MAIDRNEGIVNRRQLLVRAGSWMKASWRKSKENLFSDDDEEDLYSDNSNHSRQRRRQQQADKRPKKSVKFRDALDITYHEHNHGGILSTEEIEHRWYQKTDYRRFKKDINLTSLNYINARRASRTPDENQCCIWGIENLLNPRAYKRQEADRKRLYKNIREEQDRQRQKQKQRQKQTSNESDSSGKTSYHLNPNRFRTASLFLTRPGRDRALARGNEYARCALRQ